MPRIINFTIIAIVVGLLLVQSLRSNTTTLVQDNITNHENAAVTAPSSDPTPTEVNAVQDIDADKKSEPAANDTKANTDNTTTANPEPAKQPNKQTETTPVVSTPATADTPDATGSPGTATPVTNKELATPNILPLFPDAGANVPPKDSSANPDPFNAPAATIGNADSSEISDEEKLKQEQERERIEWWRAFRTNAINWAIFALIVFVCFSIGKFVVKSSRLPNEYSFKVSVTVLAFVGGLVAAALSWERITLGIDLSGGVVLVYDIPKTASNEQKRGQDGNITAETMNQLITAISTRINPGGQREISIKQLGQSQIQVIIPRAEDTEVQRIQKVISESGALVFRILASRAYAQDASIISSAEQTLESQVGEIRGTQGELLAQWFPVYPDEEPQFRNNPEILTRVRNERLEVLVLCNDGEDVTGKYLSYVGRGESGLKPGVTFNLNDVGAVKFGRLTFNNKPDSAQSSRKRLLGIILNEQLYTAPTLDAEISSRGIITFGQRTGKDALQKLDQDIEDLIRILNAGALPAELSKEPISKLIIGATLGEDTIRKGQIALTGSAIAVLLFMLVYYRLAGFIACFCVVTNLALLVTIMITLKSPFTLPGLAGVVLTIGMAVDANILIYERLREELTGGVSMKLAIRNAYSKALSAILDSNITSILVGCILYTIGTEQVKGFAITLIIGIILSMFTAIYCAKVIMEILEAQSRVKNFNMMQFFRRPNINFIGARFATITFSIIISVLAIVLTFVRGSSILDIDFVGGASLEMVLEKPLSIDEVRNQLSENYRNNPDPLKKLGDSAVQIVQESGTAFGTQSVTANTHFIITSPVPQIKDKEISADEYLNIVRQTIKEIFKDNLKFCKFDYSISKVTSDRENEFDVKIKSDPPINYESLKSAIDSASKNAVQEKLITNTFSYSLTAKDIEKQNQTKPLTEWTMKARTSQDALESVLGSIKKAQDDSPDFPTSTTIGSAVASDTRIAGGLAIIASLIGIVVYMGVRFKGLVYGFAAAIGLIHDVVVVLGLIAVSAWVANLLSIFQVNEFKISLSVVAAFLTIIAYSINDTIILFDRVRENRGKSPILTDRMINMAINQTLSRTVLTSLTTFFVTVILYLLGGQGIHTFAFAMCAGVAFGTYSTIGVCAPLLFWMVGTPAEKVKNNAK
ncbi:MAG: protein translocase subunit SecD [Planctomycetaceae bacterium]|jgi:SecD/SecF fusion protein|nr:protein translocase subunit SecD [Planctomycetaceae bacterium]